MNPELEVKVDERLLAKPGKSRTAIHDPELRRLRAIQMMQARVAGNSVKKVAEMFQVSEDTVQRTLTYAKRAGILVERSDTILQRMVPLAETAIIEALKDRDVDPVTRANIALKIYEGVGLLGNKGKPSGALDGDNELSKAMQELRERAELEASTTEGELVSGPPQRLLPDAVGLATARPGEEDLQQPPALAENAPDDSVRLDSAASAAPKAEGVPSNGLSRAAQSALAGRRR